jgi:dUTP pyrophosphatase
MLKIEIINRSPFPLPAYQTTGSAGMDLQADLSKIEDKIIYLPPLGRLLVPTGLYIALPQGYEAQIRPRSGLALKKGLSIPNAPGTIDSDYRGEIGVILVNLSDTTIEIHHGDRIAQLVVQQYQQIQWQPVLTLDDTTRGSGGFGSTFV